MVSSCVRCNKRQFEIVEAEPAGSKTRVLFVQCSGCGGVVGILADVGSAVKSLEKDVKEIKREVKQIMFRLS